MTDINRFTKKFNSKSKSELEYKVANPSLFEPMAVEAAKQILEKKDVSFENKTLNDVRKETKPIFKEQAHFKNKLIYRLALVWASFSLIVSLIAVIYKSRYDSIIWTVIYGSFLIVLISKHRKTLRYLKLISILALFIFAFNYTIHFVNFYSTGEEGNLMKYMSKDIKFIILYLFIIFGGELLIENELDRVNG